MPEVAPGFWDWELCTSREHPELVTPFGELPVRQVVNAMQGVYELLVPTRRRAGRIRVESFIRGEDLNRAVGGVDDSDHLVGRAVDFVPIDMSPEELLDLFLAGDVPGAEWHKLNFYTDRRAFHGAWRPVAEGPGERLVFIDWELT